MVKLSVDPKHCIVAGFAGRREARRNVIHRGSRVVVISLMARHAGRAGQVVIVVDVAVGTLSWRHGMGACQHESRAVVIECRVQPSRRAVARFARLGKFAVTWFGFVVVW